MIKAKHDGQYKQVGFIKVRRPDGTYKDVEKKYGKTNTGEYGLVFEKGFTREKSGVLPLQLDGIGKPLKDYRIEGNTYQSDGVSPDTPQEVIGAGDRTENLFNGTIEQGAITDADGNFTGGDNRIRTNLLSVIPNKIYSVSSNLCIRNISSYKDGVFIARLSDANYGYNYTITIPDEANQIALSFMPNSANVTTITPDDLEWLMLNEGSTPLPYEPYGYKIPVECRGKNLFDKSHLLAYIDVNGNIISNIANACGYAEVEPNTTYTVSSNIVASSGNRIALFDSKPEIGSVGYSIITKSQTSYEFTFTTGSTTKYVAFHTGISTEERYREFLQTAMLELGTEATEYEPYVEPITTPIYLDSPLYKIGDYSDSRGMTEEVRAVKELVLTGEEAFGYSNSCFTHSFDGKPAAVQPLKTIVYCNFYEGVEPRYRDQLLNYQFCVARNFNQIAIRDDRHADITVFKTYLQQQYANGTPVKVYYILATPETKAVDAVEIPTLDGTTVIDVDTEVKPSNVYIKYKSKT